MRGRNKTKTEVEGKGEEKERGEEEESGGEEVETKRFGGNKEKARAAGACHLILPR